MVEQARQRLASTGEDLRVVLNERRVVLGLARADDLRVEDNTPIEEVTDPGPITYRPDTLLSEWSSTCRRAGGRVNRTLVTSADGVLIGLLRRADAERALHEAHTAGERHAQDGVADGTGPGGAVARISAGLWCTQGRARADGPRAPSG